MISCPLHVNTLRLLEILHSCKSQYDELQAQEFHFCAHSNMHSLVMGLREVPNLVLTCAMRTSPSTLFGQISNTLPNGHEHLGVESSRLEPGLQREGKWEKLLPYFSSDMIQAACMHTSMYCLPQFSIMLCHLFW